MNHRPFFFLCTLIGLMLECSCTGTPVGLKDSPQKGDAPKDLMAEVPRDSVPPAAIAPVDANPQKGAGGAITGTTQDAARVSQPKDSSDLKRNSWRSSQPFQQQLATGNAEAARFLAFGTCESVMQHGYRMWLHRRGTAPSASQLLDTVRPGLTMKDSKGQPIRWEVGEAVDACRDDAVTLLLTDADLILVHRFTTAPFKAASYTKLDQFADEPRFAGGDWESVGPALLALQLEALLSRYVETFGEAPASLQAMLDSFGMTLASDAVATAGEGAVNPGVIIRADPSNLRFLIERLPSTDEVTPQIFTFHLDPATGDCTKSWDHLDDYPEARGWPRLLAISYQL